MTFFPHFGNFLVYFWLSLLLVIFTFPLIVCWLLRKWNDMRSKRLYLSGLIFLYFQTMAKVGRSIGRKIFHPRLGVCNSSVPENSNHLWRFCPFFHWVRQSHIVSSWRMDSIEDLLLFVRAKCATSTVSEQPVLWLVHGQHIPDWIMVGHAQYANARVQWYTCLFVLLW